jgi:hypothetical protein
MSQGNTALAKAVTNEIDRDATFLEKCDYHAKMCEKYGNDANKVAAAMIKKYGG